MKSFLVTAVVLIGLLTSARAQQEADEKYIAIYGVVQQAGSLAESGEPKAALASLTEAQSELQRFQKVYPDWNPGIINYRLDDLGKKIAAIQARLAATAAPPPPLPVPAAGLTAPEAAKLTAEAQSLQTQLQSVQAENQSLQAKLKEALSSQPAAIDSGELTKAQDQIRSLMKENDLLKTSAATTQITSPQSAVTVVTLEKGALENKVRQLSAELAELHAANYEGRIRDLTEQRDGLAKQVAEAGKRNPRKNADAQMAALSDETETLRARLAVDEARVVPYSSEELALFRETPPIPNPTKRSIRELPSGTAELVASAQRHFANHEFDAAEADYQKILDRDQNNGLVLANLATIELQENKLADAEKHITAALAQSPDDAYNLSTLGYLKFCEGKYDDALDILSRAAKLDPNNPETLNYLGVTLSHKGLRVQAEKALRKAIQINPLYAPAHNNLAVIYLNQSPAMPMLARWHYQKALAAGQPRNPDLEKLLADKGAPVDQ